MGESFNFINWITNLWNFIVDDQIIPDNLKTDKIIYLWKKKKGSREDPNKYRPITHVIGISKFFESILNQSLQNVSNPAMEFQHAYTKGKSTSTALLKNFPEVKKLSGSDIYSP